jgi:ABC-type glycerol-3-phosphate transport system substrate-binding protein
LNVIDRDSPIPIYYQLKNIIRIQIEQSLLKPGDQLPTEHELCQRYGISRSPVRQALNELAYEGIVTRRPAIGTFVADRSAPSHVETTIEVLGTDMRWVTVLRRAVTVWNEENPDRPVKLDASLVPHDTLYDRLNTAVGSGTAPDIGMLDCVWVPEFAKHGYLFPLESLDPEWTEKEYLSDLYPASIRANSFAGQLYGVQFEADVSLLWYRKDWFAQEDLYPPRSWTALEEIARHFKCPEVARKYGQMEFPLGFPAGVPGGEATVYNLMPFVWSAGGSVAKNGCVCLNSPATYEALEFLRSLVKSNITSVDVAKYTWDQVPRLFAQGRFAMSFGGSYEVAIITEAADWSREEFSQRVGLTTSPAAPGRAPAVTMGGTSCAIFRQSRHPELAMGLLKTAMRSDLILDFCRLSLQHTPRPSLRPRFSTQGEPFLAETAQLLGAARARPPIPDYAKVSRQLQKMFQAVLTTTKPIPAIVSRTSEFISVISEVPCA